MNFWTRSSRKPPSVFGMARVQKLILCKTQLSRGSLVFLNFRNFIWAIGGHPSPDRVASAETIFNIIFLPRMLRCATQHKHVDPGSLHLFGWALILNSRTNCFSSPHFTYQLLLKSSLYLQTASQVFAYVQTASQVFTLRTNCFSSLHFTYKPLRKSSLYVQTASQVFTLRTNCFSSLHFT